MERKFLLVFIPFLMIITIYAGADRFKMYDSSADTLGFESMKSDTILDTDSDIYKMAYKDGEEFAMDKYKKLGLFGRMRLKIGLLPYSFPDYIYERGINYECGFRDGHASKTRMPASAFILMLIAYYTLPFTILMIVSLFIN